MRSFVSERLPRQPPAAVPAGLAAAPPRPRRIPADFRRDLGKRYRARLEAIRAEADEGPAAAPPAPAPARNWSSLGPATLQQDLGWQNLSVAGRVAGLAVAPGGNRVYAAAANGGVWRSDDGGRRWRFTMDAWDQNANFPFADSLACGAIALDPNDPDRVYLGTGEGAAMLVQNGIIDRADQYSAYFGVGPASSPDGGASWVDETATPSLDGEAFYELAVDPRVEGQVVAATTAGLYRRVPGMPGTPATWVIEEQGLFTSVVVGGDATSATYYAVRWGGPVLTSPDGDVWTELNNGFEEALRDEPGGQPNAPSRMTLALAPSDPDVVYALISDANSEELSRILRYSKTDGRWRRISGAPGALFGGQGWYDQAIAVDPSDPNLLYIGGATVITDGEWTAAAYRCEVALGETPSMTYSHIGNQVHADVHALVFEPGRPDRLWLAGDGGVFFSDRPATGIGAIFEPRNTGLATMTMNHIAQNLEAGSSVFCGTQDNGLQEYSGSAAWRTVSTGDCGYAVVNWHQRHRILATVYAYGLQRSEDGGVTARTLVDQGDNPHGGQDDVLFSPPLAGTPPNLGQPHEADEVAFGSLRPWISEDFGDTWQSIPSGTSTDNLNGVIRSLVFASYEKLYAGTMEGQIYRFVWDWATNVWVRTHLNPVGGQDRMPAAYDGYPVTDIAVDPSDTSGDSIYITFGGIIEIGNPPVRDFRYVWHFDNAIWGHRSGPDNNPARQLFPVRHSAIVVDESNPDHLYVGTDVGVWRSPDRGANWTVLQDGLPDAAVIDLRLHGRLLRASTHGRGLFEYDLSPLDPNDRGITNYIRNDPRDRGRSPSTGGIIEDSPDLRVDAPDANGEYRIADPSQVDFYRFAFDLGDDSQAVVTHATATLVNRVYVQVQNRGSVTADGSRVTLLVAPAPAAGRAPSLPSNLVAVARQEADPAGNDWRRVGNVTLDDVRSDFPGVAVFSLSAPEHLPRPSGLASNDRFVLLALVDHDLDPFASSTTSLEDLCRDDRRAACQLILVVPS